MCEIRGEGGVANVSSDFGGGGGVEATPLFGDKPTYLGYTDLRPGYSALSGVGAEAGQPYPRGSCLDT